MSLNPVGERGALGGGGGEGGGGGGGGGGSASAAHRVGRVPRAQKKAIKSHGGKSNTRSQSNPAVDARPTKKKKERKKKADVCR